MVLPRYFAPRVGGEPHDVSAAVVNVIDSFTLSFGGRSTELIVGLDVDANLAVRRIEPADTLPDALRAQLAFHEVSGGAHREIELDTLFLFEMRLLEQAPDCPGVNDPVFLYGTLVGPLVPGSPNEPTPVRCMEGQLTVTRGDLLAGLVGGADWAFRHSEANHGRMACTLSLLAGADRGDAVKAGRGGVLIYPLLGVDGDIYEMSPGNEDIVCRILYDVLFAWWTDAAREAPPAFRDADTLPVPSRAQHEQRLVREGFTIRGDKAVRPRPGWSGALPGFLGKERRPLPAEADTEGFLDLAGEALVRAPEWPSPSVAALHERVHGARRSPRLPPVVSPVQSPPAAVPVTAPVPGWMQTFISAHRQSPRPHLTPGPDDPAAPRSLTPLEVAVAAKTAEVMQYLEDKFDQLPPLDVTFEEPPPRKPPGSS